jgi:hypothetical protein
MAAFSPTQPRQLFHPPAQSLPRQTLHPWTRRSTGKTGRMEKAEVEVKVKRQNLSITLADFFSILLGYFRNVAGINVQNLADGQPTDRRFDGVAGDEKVRSI